MASKQSYTKSKTSSKVFQARHYNAIADTISLEYQNPRLYPDEKAAIMRVIYSLADLFKDDNPNFNEEIFIKACGHDE